VEWLILANPNSNPAAPPQVVVLGTLLQLERQARQADSQSALGFIAVNDSHRLFPYKQALLWTFKSLGKPRVAAVSGVAVPDHNAPFIRWSADLVRKLAEDRETSHKLQLFTPDKIPQAFASGWQEWSLGQLLWCPFLDRAGKLIGGMLFFRANPWGEAEVTLAERLTDAYAHAWLALHGRRAPVRGAWRGRLAWGMFFAALIGAMFIPLRESVLAPAEIIARDPLVLSAPLDGTIKTLHVAPNEKVEANQPLFSLDDTNQKHQYAIAWKTLQVAQAELFSTEQKAFSDPRSKSELALLKAKVAEREAELKYVAELLERMEVRAPRPGIAVFTDPNDWLGKPVRVGEKIMTLADPSQTEIRLWVPVADALNLEAGAPVQLFLNTDPTRPYAGEVYQSAYEAELSPENVLAFQVKAHLSGAQPLRLGLKGTGKVYGEEVRLYYYLFRRPLATARQWLGI
jgi:hypothetical protein